MAEGGHHDSGVQKTLTAVELGAVVGGILGAAHYIFAKTDPALLPPDVVTNHVPLAGLAKSTLGKAATLAIVGGVYQGTQSFLESSVGKSNWNTAIGGCAAGFALGVRTGSSRTALVGCVGLSALAPFLERLVDNRVSDEEKVQRKYDAEVRELREKMNGGSHKGH